MPLSTRLVGGAFALVLLAFSAGCAGGATDVITADAPVEQPATFDHSAFDRLLAEYVDADGMVDYAGLRADQDAVLRPYLRQLARTDPSNLSRDDELAFWINAYNALAIKLVVDNYPVGSIREIKPSGLPFIPKVNSPFRLDVSEVGGEERTLDEIEHGIIRERFADEPRIHVAVVCAAMSCPELRQEAYVGARLDAQLDDQARSFLRTESKNRIPAGEGLRIELSKIFDWYGGDFVTGDESKAEAVMRFAADYFEGDVQSALRRGAYDVRYLSYDWSLNEQPGSRADGASTGAR